MKSWRFPILGLVMVLFMAFFSACGGGGGTGGGTTGDVCTVTGTVYAPNGTDPIEGATIYVPDSTSAGLTRSEVYELAGEAPSRAITTTQSGSDGSFSLLNVPTGTTTIIIQKGLFKKTITKSLSGDTALSTSETTLSTNTGDIPNIVVITGFYDRMQDVLAKLGLGTLDSTGKLELGTEKFTLVDGDFTLDDATYQNIGDFLADPTEMAKYDIIFINCGAVETALSDTTVQDNIRNFVANGGRIYVTDLAKDFVDKVFNNTDYLKFLGEVGDSGITVEATILDSDLLAWLKNFANTVNADDTVTIEGFLGGWAVIDTFNTTNVKSWVKGPVTYSGGTAATKDLTFTFSYGSSGGKVLYSSYHTEDTPSTELRPQERILEYLVFFLSE